MFRRAAVVTIAVMMGGISLLSAKPRHVEVARLHCTRHIGTGGWGIEPCLGFAARFLHVNVRVCTHARVCSAWGKVRAWGRGEREWRGLRGATTMCVSGRVCV